MSKKVITLVIVAALAAPAAAWAAKDSSPLITSRFVFDKASLPEGREMPAWSKGMVLRTEGITASVYGNPEQISKIYFSIELMNKSRMQAPVLNIEGLRVGERTFALHEPLIGHRSQSVQFIRGLGPGQKQALQLVVPVYPIKGSGVPVLLEAAKKGALRIWIREILPPNYVPGLSGLARIAARFTRSL